MYLNKIYYKINNENLKKFNVIDNSFVKTFFIVSDFSKISVDEVVRLLSNNRKIIIDDNAIVDIEKIYEIKATVDTKEAFENLFISKEAIIKTWLHTEHADLLFDLEILNENNSDNVVISDAYLNHGIKLKYLEKPNHLLKMLDSSIYVKKLIIDAFDDDISINLKDEFESIINFGNQIKNNLITSSNIFIEELSKRYDVICNVLDIDNCFYPELNNCQRIGIASVFDFSTNAISFVEGNDISNLPESIKKEFLDASWIDAVKLRYYIKKQNISKVILENLEYFDNFSEIKVCNEYGVNQHRTKTYVNFDESDDVVPLYSKFVGWKTPIYNINDYRFIPKQVFVFLHSLKRLLCVKELVVRLANFEIAV